MALQGHHSTPPCPHLHFNAPQRRFSPHLCPCVLTAHKNRPTARQRPNRSTRKPRPAHYERDGVVLCFLQFFLDILRNLLGVAATAHLSRAPLFIGHNARLAGFSVPSNTLFTFHRHSLPSHHTIVVQSSAIVAGPCGIVANPRRSPHPPPWLPAASGRGHRPMGYLVLKPRPECPSYQKSSSPGKCM